MVKIVLNKFILIILVVIIYSNNLSVEQKIGRNQEDVLGYKKREISDLQKYAIQEEFKYIENNPGY